MVIIFGKVTWKPFKPSTPHDCEDSKWAPLVGSDDFHHFLSSAHGRAGPLAILDKREI